MKKKGMRMMLMIVKGTRQHEEEAEEMAEWIWFGRGGKKSRDMRTTEQLRPNRCAPAYEEKMGHLETKIKSKLKVKPAELTGQKVILVFGCVCACVCIRTRSLVEATNHCACVFSVITRLKLFSEMESKNVKTRKFVRKRRQILIGA